MKTKTVAEVKTHLSALLKEVKSGSEIGITFGKSKETIAVIIPVNKHQRLKNGGFGILAGKVNYEIKPDFKESENDFLGT